MALEGSCRYRATTFSLQEEKNNTSDHTTPHKLEPLPSHTHTHTIKCCHPSTILKTQTYLGQKSVKAQDEIRVATEQVLDFENHPGRIDPAVT